MDDIIFQIQTHLKKYKAYCACERDLEMLNNEESELNFNQKKRLEEEAKAKKEHNKQTVKEQNDLYTSYSSNQNTSSKNDLTKTIQVVKR